MTKCIDSCRFDWQSKFPNEVNSAPQPPLRFSEIGIAKAIARVTTKLERSVFGLILQNWEIVLRILYYQKSKAMSHSCYDSILLLSALFAMFTLFLVLLSMQILGKTRMRSKYNAACDTSIKDMKARAVHWQ